MRLAFERTKKMDNKIALDVYCSFQKAAVDIEYYFRNREDLQHIRAYCTTFIRVEEFTM